MATADHPDCRDTTRAPAPGPACERDVDPHEAWRGLIRGGQRVTEHVRTGSVHMFVTKAAEAGRSSGGALTIKEMQAAIGRAQGASIKTLARDLELSHSVVSHCVVNALRKLKLRSEAELVALFGPGAASVPVFPPMTEIGWPVAMPKGLRARRVMEDGGAFLVVTYPAPPWSIPDCFSAAEGAVVRALIDGLRPGEVARARGIAPRTVANHLAAVYRKMNVHSRVELFVALRRT